MVNVINIDLIKIDATIVFCPIGPYIPAGWACLAEYGWACYGRIRPLTPCIARVQLPVGHSRGWLKLPSTLNRLRPEAQDSCSHGVTSNVQGLICLWEMLSNVSRHANCDRTAKVCCKSTELSQYSLNKLSAIPNPQFGAVCHNIW